MRLKYISIFLTASSLLCAQQPVPAPPQAQKIIITGATIHVGDGQVLENASISFENGKILSVRQDAEPDKAGARVIDGKGKHVYPGFIALNTILGLSEVEAARATNDYVEVGSINPNVRSIIAYNTDSKVTPTVRSNGILMAQIVPQGGLISGQSAVVQLDAWNWEDASILSDEGIQMNWPSMVAIGNTTESVDAQREKSEKQVELLREFLKEAKAYSQGDVHEKNLRFEAMRGLFNGSKKLYVHADYAKEILSAIETVKPLGVRLVIVGGADAPLVAAMLKENNIPVILNRLHALPPREGADIDYFYKLPFVLQQAGVVCAISVEGFWQVRNLPFNAGTAAAYGLSHEEALKAITLTPARILGIERTTGSLEAGKDATLFISSGDALDMKTNNVEQAFIQGRQIQTDNIQTELYHRYLKKYGLN